MLEDNSFNTHSLANISLIHFVLSEYQRISFRFTRISAYFVSFYANISYFVSFYANISVFHFISGEYQPISFHIMQISAYFLLR